MTAQTHKQFCIWTTYFGVLYMYIKGYNAINYYLMLYIMLKISVAGALFPDVDHYWKNVKEKTAINWILNKLIHITGGKHRSWQTHSWDICIVTLGAIMTISKKACQLEWISLLDYEVLNMVVIAFYLGWISHLISDMLTSDGVRLFCFSKKKVKIVPRKMTRFRVLVTGSLLVVSGLMVPSYGLQALSVALVFIGGFLIIAGIKLGNIVFNTGKEWEMFVYKSSRVINLFMGMFTLAYPIIMKLKIGE